MKIDSAAFDATLAQYEQEDRTRIEEGPGFGADAGLPLFAQLASVEPAQAAATPATPATSTAPTTPKGTPHAGRSGVAAPLPSQVPPLAGAQAPVAPAVAAAGATAAASTVAARTAPGLTRSRVSAGGAAAPGVPVDGADAAPAVTPPASTVSASKTPADEAAVAAPQTKKPLWSLRRKPAGSSEEQSSAMRPNRQRTLVISAALFLVGIVAGPWLAHKAVPEAPPPSGPGQSVQAIADTLKASALGMPVPALSTATSGSASMADAHVAATSESAAGAGVVPSGEGRYLAMLQSMKAGEAAAAAPIHLVPKMGATAPAEMPAGRVGGLPAKPQEAYPLAAIPLEIESGREQRRASELEPARAGGAVGPQGPGAQPLAVASGADATGRYQVLRIAFNREGVASALMMPLGGRPQRDAGWVFAGDATADGFAIEAISPRHVLLRAPSGRLLELVPQS